MPRNKILFLSPELVRIFHRAVLERDGGAKGEFEGRLDSILGRVKSSFFYLEGVDLLEVAAMYGAYLSRGHAFTDGNKRTALMSMLAFIQLHRYFTPGLPHAEIATLMEHCANGKLTERALYDKLFEYIKNDLHELKDFPKKYRYPVPGIWITPADD